MISNDDEKRIISKRDHADVCSMLSDIVDVFVNDPDSDIPVVMLRGVWATLERYTFVDPLPPKYLDDARRIDDGGPQRDHH